MTDRTDAPVIGYMCLTDYWHELGESINPSQVYSSVEILREMRKCVNDCGIVEVEIRLKKTVQEPKDNYRGTLRRRLR